MRNFYARSLLMIVFFAKVAETSGNPLTLRANWQAVEDEWTNKDLRNFDIYDDNRFRVIPNHYNKLPEATAWKMNQPGYMKSMPQKYLGKTCLLYTSPSPRDQRGSRMPSSA